jgi:hypothetical protein
VERDDIVKQEKQMLSTDRSIVPGWIAIDGNIIIMSNHLAGPSYISLKLGWTGCFEQDLLSSVSQR